MRDINYLDLVAAREIGPDAVHEASLARIWQHVQKAGTKSFGILTSYRSAAPGSPKSVRDAQDAKNKTTFSALKVALDDADLGYIPLKGSWKEQHDEGEVWVSEMSLFVPEIPLDLILSLGKKYDQDAVIYAGPETDGQVTAFSRDGSKSNLGKFHPKTISDFYSELKGGRKFVFEWIGGPGSWMMAAGVHAARKDPEALRLRANKVIQEIRAQFDPTFSVR